VAEATPAASPAPAADAPAVAEPVSVAEPGTDAVPDPVAAALPGQPRSIDVSCETDADCEIKDIGSCCGYYPRCVNADSDPQPERVRAECAAEGRVSTCGFPSVSGCACVANQCVNTLEGDGTPVR
jgi:hypothetical protein